MVEEEAKVRANEVSNLVIGAAIEVHRHLGPGLLESAYEGCLAYELMSRGIPFQKQLELPVVYKGTKMDCAYRLDFLVSGLVIVELKAVDKLEKIHDAQLLTYLCLSNLWLGLLINFNVEYLRNGVKRLVFG